MAIPSALAALSCNCGVKKSDRRYVAGVRFGPKADIRFPIRSRAIVPETLISQLGCGSIPMVGGKATMKRQIIATILTAMLGIAGAKAQEANQTIRRVVTGLD